MKKRFWTVFNNNLFLIKQSYNIKIYTYSLFSIHSIHRNINDG